MRENALIALKTLFMHKMCFNPMKALGNVQTY